MVRLPSAQRWKNSALPTMVEWQVKLIELAQKDKRISFIRKRTMRTLIGNWNPQWNLCIKMKSVNLQFIVLMIRQID